MMKSAAGTISPISSEYDRLKEEVTWDGCENGEAGADRTRGWGLLLGHPVHV